jgi:hypothetical protein
MSDGYLLHFEPAYRHARHYLGVSDRDVPGRIACHLAGKGSPLIRAVGEAGGRVFRVRTFPGMTRGEERRLKRQGGLSRHCPACRALGTWHR